MKYMTLLAFLISAGPVLAAETAIQIPSDSSAKYFVLGKGGTGNERTITTKRVGSSGTGYSTRLYNCDQGTVKYLGTGDSIEAMAASQPDPSMSQVVPGSIAHYVGLEACK